MKNGKIILSTAALVVAFASAFAIKSHNAKKGPGTLVTWNGAASGCFHVSATVDNCSAGVTLYTTTHGTKVARPYQSAD